MVDFDKPPNPSNLLPVKIYSNKAGSHILLMSQLFIFLQNDLLENTLVNKLFAEIIFPKLTSANYLEKSAICKSFVPLKVELATTKSGRISWIMFDISNKSGSFIKL